ncbi:VWA domain-containing protein [Aquimarina sp. RZ0]|uniref:vWA domain-containing protein n=1 Tax=Aquimarina sp. RZ0 TaxID=2607730 RepID=UPI0011F1B0AC|nr:VWA domain-containing protein [Aquimarina sp. RZ0]KAA1245471.1 DUF3520 domain-containing protein [Aquimarina sp. RZ0]
MKVLYYFMMIFLYTGMSFAQQLTITGVITEKETGVSIPGVNILVKGTNRGVLTDFDGKYVIKVDVGDILVVSSLGFETENVQVKSDMAILNIEMIEDTASLDEVIVVGYGASRRSCITRSERRKSRRARKKSNALSTTPQRSGAVVSGLSTNNANIQIRGHKSSITSTEPLYIVDGVPVDKKKVAHIQELDPSKIASVKVLKNTNATAIYGSRAIHGCVVITTHNGDYKITDNESYKEIVENNFERVQTAPLSTFSIDVDKASYSNVRRMINNGIPIPADAVKLEEMINYFDYEYAQPVDKHPFAIHTERGTTPWNAHTQLVKIGIKGKEISQETMPASNLVFLIDVSGSMNDVNKLPLLKKAFKVLVHQLREQDMVSIVVYAGAAGMVLKPTSGVYKNKINEALDQLSAGGSTAGGEGIALAYKIAQKNYKKNGNNRVILATDGDFNVGMSSDKDMKTLIEEKRKSGVFLTCLGFGMNNYKDSKLETLADKGNGNHAYIDTMQEAQRILGKEFGGTLHTIAKDVKIQVEFNPEKVQAYRLIGYENRLLADEDFVDDTKDAGELGSGHTVTALYEVIPAGVESNYLKDISDLKYTTNKTTQSDYRDELLTVKFRYKKPTANTSIEMIHVVKADDGQVSEDFNFAAAVAWFGMKIRKSKYIDNDNLQDIIALASGNRTSDDQGYRAEFIRLLNSYLVM